MAVLPMARDGTCHASWARRACHADAVGSPTTPATERHLAPWLGSPQPGEFQVQGSPPAGYLEIERALVASLPATANPNGDRTPNLADLERMLSGRTEVNGIGQRLP
jgi:hypothetical protein